MFNIPMNTKPSLSLDSLSSMGDGAQPMSNQAPVQNGFGAPAQPQQQMAQPQAQQSWGQPTQAAQPMQNTYQQPVQNQGFGQPAPAQGGFSQPTQAPQPMQNTYQQPAPQPMQSAPAAPAPTQRPSGGGVILKKGQKTSLTKMNPNLDLIEVGLGWDLAPGGAAYDLDVEAFLLGADGRVIGDDWFVFYNQPASPDGAVRLLGDSRTGEGAGDDEVIQVKLSQLNPGVAKIVFIVTINEAKERGYNFSNVTNAYVRIVDKQTNRELVKFNLTDYYNTVCSMMVGEVYKHNGEYRFNPIGDGTGDDLMGLCMRYGVNVAG